MTRTEILNLLAARRGYRSYLEIGVRDPRANFQAVNCAYKHGVDPAGNCRFQMSSDEFFAGNVESYDLIFIDGLHTEQQAWRDLENSMCCLREGGAIVLHDCNPPTEWHASETFNGGAWNGTVWRAFVRARHSHPEWRMFTVDDDWGVGVVTRREDRIVASFRPEIVSPYSGTEDLSYAYLRDNRAALLDLMPASDFLQVVLPSGASSGASRTDVALQLLKSRLPAGCPQVVADRLLAWSCLSSNHHLAMGAISRVRKCPETLALLRSGEVHGVMFALSHDRGRDLRLPNAEGSGISIVPVYYDDGIRFGHDVVSKLYKIALPLLFPSVRSSVYVDADVTLPASRQRWDLAFELARYEFAVTAHPQGTWVDEPMLSEQRRLYDQSLPALLPLTMNGVVIRSHESAFSLALSRQWLAEYFRFPFRDQPALVAACRELARYPLMANELLMAWSPAGLGGHEPLFSHA